MNENYEHISSQISRIGIVPVIKLEKTENAESFKIFFIIKNGNVYIKKAGVSVREEGEYISDLDK